MIKLFALFLALSITFPLMAEERVFGNLCPDVSVSYCKDVGKRAFNAFGIQALREIDLGPIVGTTFKYQGAVISAPIYPVRLSSRDAWYYIVGPGGVSTEPFLREAREISPQD